MAPCSYFKRNLESHREYACFTVRSLYTAINYLLLEVQTAPSLRNSRPRQLPTEANENVGARRLSPTCRSKNIVIFGGGQNLLLTLLLYDGPSGFVSFRAVSMTLSKRFIAEETYH